MGEASKCKRRADVDRPLSHKKVMQFSNSTLACLGIPDFLLQALFATLATLA
jgi:hypothetical protein